MKSKKSKEKVNGRTLKKSRPIDVPVTAVSFGPYPFETEPSKKYFEPLGIPITQARSIDEISRMPDFKKKGHFVIVLEHENFTKIGHRELLHEILNLKTHLRKFGKKKVTLIADPANKSKSHRKVLYRSGLIDGIKKPSEFKDLIVGTLEKKGVKIPAIN